MRTKRRTRRRVLPDTVCLALRKVHQQRYEAIRNWRERQEEPYFTEVDDRWREEFEEQMADGRQQTAVRGNNPPASGLMSNA